MSSGDKFGLQESQSLVSVTKTWRPYEILGPNIRFSTSLLSGLWDI
jgi:hypothetical protein